MGLFTEFSQDDAAAFAMRFAGRFKTKLTNILDAQVPDIRDFGLEAIPILTRDTVHIVTLDCDWSGRLDSAGASLL